MEKKRSKGIIVLIAILVIAYALNWSGLWLKISEALMNIGATPELKNAVYDVYAKQYAINTPKMAGKAVGITIALLVLLGIYSLKEWARKLMIILICFQMFMLAYIQTIYIKSYISLFHADGAYLGWYLNIGLILLYIIFDIGIIIFLTRPAVKEQFK